MRAPTPATYWRTLRHLRWSQLGYLVMRRILPRASLPAKIKGPVGLRAVTGPWRFLEWQPQASRRMIATRVFTFLNRTVPSHDAIPWNDRRHSKLWLYHLNYFDYLNVGLRFPDEEALLDSALQVALNWCELNTQGNEVGWEPYPLSLRIVNWLKFLARHDHALQEFSREVKKQRLLESLGVQVTMLERRLEKDLLGNHLLKNLKALLFAGAWLETSASSRWWAEGAELLKQQLNEQILPDGGHFERSPMYHSQVLEDLADIRFLCASTERSLPCAGLLSEKIRSMAQFLKSIVHPDGEIPLFNDSVLGGARSPDCLLAISGLPALEVRQSSPQVMVFPDTGYGVIRRPEIRSALIFDCGPLGPEYQPGHGHCDVLSYELSLLGHRVVVDAGVSTYERVPMRYFERSTAAHNILRVDGEELAEIWASFRVGRRPRVGQICGGACGAFSFLSGEHDAYRRLGVAHARKILWRAPDTWIATDLLRGSGIHRVESFLHFHPSVCIEAVAEFPNAATGFLVRHWAVKFANQTYALVTYGGGQFEVLESSYSDHFGKYQTSAVLCQTYQGTIPAGIIHIFTPATVPLPRIAANWSEEWIEIDSKRILLDENRKLKIET